MDDQLKQMRDAVVGCGAIGCGVIVLMFLLTVIVAVIIT